MVIKILDKCPEKSLLLIKNATLGTYDVMIRKGLLPGQREKPMYESFSLLEHFSTLEEARRAFEGLKNTEG